MESPLTLRRPSNWQDFEMLCKKLWGEIWNCPEIKKNGRNGQSQNGVDISGIPFGEIRYYGIQCKGKKEYQHKQLTQGEILKEIENAKSFQPPLKKLYLTTTADKDVNIEEYVRKINLENIEKEIFEVHLYSWPDIVELIDENENTHNWYLKSQSFKTKHRVKVTFENGLEEITTNPIYRKLIRNYRQKIAGLDHLLFGSQHPLLAVIPPLRPNPITSNLSLFNAKFLIKNTGDTPIEDYKILIKFDGELNEVAYTNNDDAFSNFSLKGANRIIIKESQSLVEIIPENNILVSEDSIVSEPIYLKCLPIKCELTVNWRLISKSFKDSGALRIIVNPKIETESVTILVTDPFDVKIEEGEVEDYIVIKKR